jgi:MFS family permease
MTTLTLLFTLAFLVSVDLRTLGPVPSIASPRNASAGSTGPVMTSYSLAYGTGQLVYGPLSDRPGRIAVVRLATLGFSALGIVTALSHGTWRFVGARLLGGTFAGAVIPLTLVSIGARFEYAERQVARLFAGIAVGTAALGRRVDAGLGDLMLALAGVGLAAAGLLTAGARTERAG